jgi:hypothetical protein
VRAARADLAIALNLLGREVLPAWPGVDRPDPFRRPGAQADRDISRKLRAVVEVLELAQMETAARETMRADVPITPRFGPGTWRHFQLADYFLAAGAEAAEAALPRLAQLARPQQSTVGTHA